MNTDIDIELQDSPTADNATIAANINGSAAGYVDVLSPSVCQWLGENALREKIDIFLSSSIPPSDNPAYGPTLALRGALKQLLIAQSNADTVLDVRPGTGNRQLLDNAPASLIDGTDRANLMRRARPGWVDVTAADVAARRAAMAMTAAKDVVLIALETYASSVRSAVLNAIDIASLPTVPDPLSLP